jgi:3-oxoacyl-[acyl-carrier protein] reductase
VDIPEAWQLAGRVCLVTGAGGAIGSEVAELLHTAGGRVVCTDRDAEAAAAVAKRLGARAEAAPLDVTDASAVHDVMADVTRRLGTLDVMCNLAGIPGRSQPILELDEASFDEIFAVHFKGVLFGSQAAARVMVERGGGAIVNMSSEAIDLAPATITSYSVSKAAVSTLTRVLAAEVADRGVRVNAIAPSFIPTPLSLVRYPEGEAREAYLDWWRAKSPLGRLCSVRDVAWQVLYLASAASGFVTGQTLRTNGGITMPW